MDNLRISALPAETICSWLCYSPRNPGLPQQGVKTIDHQVDLLMCHVERRHEAQGIRSRGVEQHAFLERLFDDRGGDRHFQIKRKQETSAANLAKTMARGKLLQFAFVIKTGISR